MGTARPGALVLDAGALIGFDRGDARMRALVRMARHSSTPLVVPAGALGQAWRDGTRQARLAALVGSRDCTVDVVDELTAKAAGVLCGRAHASDIVDATVVLSARVHRATIVTSDPDDLRRLDPTARLERI